MSLSFLNTLKREKQVFQPLEPGTVKMYTCGPTVYDYAHIGNFRAYVFEDLLRRYLKYKGFNVVQVMNLTDIDDKTIRGSIDRGVSLNDYTKEYIEAFFEDLSSLNIEPAEYYPRATDHIQEMIALIQDLMDKGYAYKSGDSVYFRIEKFKGYGKLSNKNLEMNIDGARIDSDEYERDSCRDFVLWKGKKEGEPFWDSPFGEGRPGWHIECSAMGMKYLGETFDIHTGGEDNIFPHHENEIAQSEASTGKEFVRYWMHCKFLLVNNEKMSKSKGNFYTLRSLMEKGFSPIAVRYLLLSHNYGHPLNFTLEGLEQSDKAIKRIRDCVMRLKTYRENGDSDIQQELEGTAAEFEACLDDDLNIAKALAAVFDFVSDVNVAIEKETLSQEGREAALSLIMRFDTVLGILTELDEKVPQEIMEKVAARQEARTKKDFAVSDKLRDEISAAGWVVEDTPEGPIVKRK